MNSNKSQSGNAGNRNGIRQNIVFLPATEPGDTRFGRIPECVEAFPEASLHTVQFPSMVWYNGVIRKEAVAQIRALDAAPLVLVGFSKSGLGAWNIARTIPELIAATVIFDAPAARAACPPWGLDPFYADDAAWQQDLPLRSVGEFRDAAAGDHTLVLISGASFHDEMATLAEAVSAAGIRHVFLPRPDCRHHWQSGWLEEGLQALNLLK